jgi:quinol monooxygenase YgiN
MNISVITTLNCSVDAEEALQIELKKLILASLAEEGCLSYEIYECNDEKGQYIITELWESEDALNAHKLSPHYK